MIYKLGIWLHVLLHGHKPYWKSYDVGSWATWRACARCHAQRWGDQDARASLRFVEGAQPEDVGALRQRAPETREGGNA